MGHLPHRNWCRVCVQSKGRDTGHKVDDGKERKLAEHSWDYCFPGDELGFKWTVLVGKERRGKSLMATSVPTKGSTGKFAVDKCLEFIEESGDKEGSVIVKTDQEAAIEYLVKELVEARNEGRRLLRNLSRRAAVGMGWRKGRSRNSRGR